jgi:hypothetical protein
MTAKSEFNAEEWSLIVDAPALAALRVATADRGGTLRESISLARVYAEARKRGGGGELLTQVVSSPPQLDPARAREQLGEQASGRLREAIELVDLKATTEEADEYRRFVLRVADTVAHAHKEGGVLGIGGKPVSERERAVLDELSQTVGVAAP